MLFLLEDFEFGKTHICVAFSNAAVWNLKCYVVNGKRGHTAGLSICNKIKQVTQATFTRNHMKSDSWFLTSSAVCRFSTLMVLWGSWENRGKPKLKDSTHLNPEMTIRRHQVCRLNRKEVQYYSTHVWEVWKWKLDLSLHSNWWYVFLFDLSFLRTNWNFWILLMSRDLTMEGENCEAFWVNFPPFLPLHFEHWKLSAKWPALESENEEGSIRNLFGCLESTCERRLRHGKWHFSPSLLW